MDIGLSYESLSFIVILNISVTCKEGINLSVVSFGDAFIFDVLK